MCFNNSPSSALCPEYASRVHAWSDPSGRNHQHSGSRWSVSILDICWSDLLRNSEFGGSKPVQRTELHFPKLRICRTIRFAHSCRRVRRRGQECSPEKFQTDVDCHGRMFTRLPKSERFDGSRNWYALYDFHHKRRNLYSTWILRISNKLDSVTSTVELRADYFCQSTRIGWELTSQSRGSGWLCVAC